MRFLIFNSGDLTKDYLQKEVEILRSKSHWKKAYFYLWDEVLAFEVDIIIFFNVFVSFCNTCVIVAATECATV